MRKIKDVFPAKYDKIFVSILPGGDNWEEEDRECFESCPYYTSCKHWGPSGKLCSENWKLTPLKPMALMVMKHVFDNYDHYNSEDLPYSENASVISEIRSALDFPFDESLSPTEMVSIVNVRLRQAEFKANLFMLWSGCSLDKCVIDQKYLVASHILPWAKSTDEEKVSCYNGLLLPANYDYLFDRHLISFSKTGELLPKSSQSSLLESLYKTLGINRKSKLTKVPAEMRKFMAQHREQFDKIIEAISKKE